VATHNDGRFSIRYTFVLRVAGHRGYVQRWPGAGTVTIGRAIALGVAAL